MLEISSIELSVSDAVGLINQTLENVYPNLIVVGEVSNIRISKGKWLYFDLKDNFAKLACFGTVYVMPGPLEDGMLVRIIAAPRLHPMYGFTVTVQSIQLVGEGTIKKGAELLYKKLEAEGIFSLDRKRLLPRYPERIALITSDESAAYSDFIKIINARWPLLKIKLYSVLVQGSEAPSAIVEALQKVSLLEDCEVVVVTRGGGGADDLAAFSDERVVRAVAASRIPTLIAIGHERDESLAELAADMRASTPSNAAEILAPDKNDMLRALANERKNLSNLVGSLFSEERKQLKYINQKLSFTALDRIKSVSAEIKSIKTALLAYNPEAVLRRGYALVRASGKTIKTVEDARNARTVDIIFQDGAVKADVQ